MREEKKVLEEGERSKLNENLGGRVFAAVTSGIFAATMSAPFISIMDKAITSNASGREPLWTCVQSGFRMLFKHPGEFLKQPSFKWIAFVYSGTYVVANLTQLGCEVQEIPWQYPKFVATSATNISLSILKDRAFAKMFSQVGSPARPFPLLALALFGARDAMTVFASFNLPPIITPWVENFGVPLSLARAAVQLTTPLAMQILSVPLHLYALDLYNRPAVVFSERASFVRREYLKTVFARWGRILPAFGIGGVINAELLDFSKNILK